MPGVQVKWSADARDALREVEDAYLRRRAKARVEKYARSKKIPVITCQLALPMIEETVGRDKLGAGWDTLLAKTKFEPATAPGRRPRAPASPFTWTEDATARLNRVPAGFMRDMTREEVEKVAARRGCHHHRSRRVRGRYWARAGDDERGDRGVRFEQEAAVADADTAEGAPGGAVRRPRGRRRWSRCASSIATLRAGWRWEGNGSADPLPTGAPSASTLATAASDPTTP